MKPGSILFAPVSTFTLVADKGTFVLTGNDAAFKAPFHAGTGSFAFTGNAAGLRVVRKLIAATGAFTFTGNANVMIPFPPRLVHNWNVFQLFQYDLTHGWDVKGIAFHWDLNHRWTVIETIFNSDLNHTWRVLPDVIPLFSEDVQMPCASIEPS
jgi:hypothetical protein